LSNFFNQKTEPLCDGFKFCPALDSVVPKKKFGLQYYVLSTVSDVSILDAHCTQACCAQSSVADPDPGSGISKQNLLIAFIQK
jgi:hypothetical protein